ncbi:hypothetical protein LguiA_011295 [Lonicera macranthoides]
MVPGLVSLDGAESWKTVSWVQDPKLCTKTIERPCCLVGERPRNADLVVCLDSG